MSMWSIKRAFVIEEQMRDLPTQGSEPGDVELFLADTAGCSDDVAATTDADHGRIARCAVPPSTQPLGS